MSITQIDPYDLYTLQQVDDAIADVVQECEYMEQDLRQPPDDYTFGWLRGCKTSLAIGKGLKQRLQNRRAEIVADIKHNRQMRIERMFMDICKETMPKEDFTILVAKAEGRLTKEQPHE